MKNNNRAGFAALGLPLSLICCPALTNAQNAQDTPSNPPVMETPRSAQSDSVTPSLPLPSKADVPAITAPDAARAQLVIASQGGAYQDSQALAYFEAFQREKGIVIKAVSHHGALGNLQGGSAPWDVVDLPREQAAKACAEGRLEKLDADGLLGTGARQDFIGGPLDECSLPNTVWSSVFLYDTRVFEKRTPSVLQDIFDIARFPGKRALPKNPRYVLETALRADGVAASEIYNSLETADGLKRAFSRLDRIKPHIVWWDKPADATALLAKKQAAFALSFSGRAFFAIVRERQPFAILWNGQVLNLNMWGIVKGSANQAQAMDFIKFALEPKRLAQQTRWFPYGPARVSSVAHVSKHAEINMEMTPFLPTTPANLKDAIFFDGAFWARNGAALDQRFADWMAGKIDASGNPMPSPAEQPQGTPRPR